jgi:hypothetical protein
VPLPLLSGMPQTLYETGLYDFPDAGPSQISHYATPFTPVYPLWSDGESKHRWAYIPPCERIDTSDMDRWNYPAGTRLWKDFWAGGAVVETRLLYKNGPGMDDWNAASYQWPANTQLGAGNALLVIDGASNVNGTAHDIPSLKDCGDCHGTLDRVLGFSAFGLTVDNPSPQEYSIQTLSANDQLTVPAPNGFHPPGDATVSAALGYMHNNCGGCHDGLYPTSVLDIPNMRLRVGQTTPPETNAYRTLIGVPVAHERLGATVRVIPEDPDDSLVVRRISVRGADQMPRIATKVVDDNGVAIIRAWINSL